MNKYEELKQEVAEAVVRDALVEIVAHSDVWKLVKMALHEEPCSGCGKLTHPYGLFRCYYCRTWYCILSTCAGKHFAGHATDAARAALAHEIKIAPEHQA